LAEEEGEAGQGKAGQGGLVAVLLSRGAGRTARP